MAAESAPLIPEANQDEAKKKRELKLVAQAAIEQQAEEPKKSIFEFDFAEAKKEKDAAAKEKAADEAKDEDKQERRGGILSFFESDQDKNQPTPEKPAEEEP